MQSAHLRTPERHRRLAWIAIAVVALSTALLGGSSRYDVAQIVVLRPLAALLLIPILMLLHRSGTRSWRTPLLLLVALMALMALQLIPLPPAMWQRLPERSTIATLDHLVGLGDIWRPLSLAPTRTTNSLASTIVPLTALLAGAALPSERPKLLLVVIGIGLISGLIGLLQLVGDETRALYFYRVTVVGQAVGLLANNNHAGVLSALTMLVIAHVASERARGAATPGGTLLLGAAFIFALVCALTAASRAATIGAAFSLIASVLIVGCDALRVQPGRSINVARLRRIALASITAIGSIIAFVLFTFWHDLSVFDRLSQQSLIEDLRYQLLPVLRHMAETFLFFGSGFGSFQDVYRIFEPTVLLTPKYINQAHNDWLQLVIEGGVPALLLVAATVSWIIRQIVRSASQGDKSFTRFLFWGAAFGLLAFASAVDYPLRTPLFQVIVIWLILVLGAESNEDRQSRSGAGDSRKDSSKPNHPVTMPLRKDGTCS